MKILVLGSIQLVIDGQPVPIGRRRERLVLGLLALNVGQSLSADRLAAAVWPDGDAPADHRSALQVSVSRLRRILTPHGLSIGGRGDTYTLDIAPESVDATRFRADVIAAMQITAPGKRAEALRSALAWWRGDVLADVAGPDGHTYAADLNELRDLTLERRIAADIECGRHAECVVELRGLVARRPAHEGFIGLLMAALYQSGQQAEALHVYAVAQRLLDEELGVDPSAALTTLHTRILRDEPLAELIVTPAVFGGPAEPVIRMLPRAVPAFIGRDQDLAAIDHAVHDPETAALVVVTGAGGVGKTALAVHWGRSHANAFPDGQMFVNLRGFGARRSLTSTEALTQLLVALGTPLTEIPAAADAAAGLYRSTLAGKRALIVLDNAGSADQVRPLLPASDACVVLVTSRDRLAGLTAGEGAVGIPLHRLARDQSLSVLRSLIGSARVDADTTAAGELAERCGDLPLALRVAAANLVGRPDTPITSYCREIDAGALDALQIEGDLSMGVRAVLSHSYEALPPPARRLLALFAVPAGIDVTVGALRAMAGSSVDDVSRRITALLDAHLVEESEPGRYVVHDLVRSFASEVIDADGDAGVATSARLRLLAHYIHSSDAAARLGRDQELKLGRDPLPDDVEIDQIESIEAARAWIDREHANLVSEAVRAADQGPLAAAWQIADSLYGYFWLRRDAAQWLTSLDAAAAAATKAGEDAVLANITSRTGAFYWCVADYPAAEAAYERALRLNRSIGRRVGEASVHLSLAVMQYERGRLEDSRENGMLGATIYQEIGQKVGEADAWGLIADIARDQGDLDGAIDFAFRSADINREISNRESLAASLSVAASAYLEQDVPDVQLAIALAQEALKETEAVESYVAQSGTLALLAEATVMAGEHAEALGYAERSVKFAAEAKHAVSDCAALLSRGIVRLETGDEIGATDDFTAALRIGEEIDYPQVQIRCLVGLAQSDDAARAMAYLERASDIVEAKSLTGLRRVIERARGRVEQRVGSITDSGTVA